MTTKITVKDNGSIKVEGDFEICDSSGTPFGLAGRKAISLCRCGHTKNSPFCDGAHASCRFESKVTAVELPPMKK